MLTAGVADLNFKLICISTQQGVVTISDTHQYAKACRL